jgi:hypothetical protein
MTAWVVVENAGYEGEYVWPTLHRTLEDAERWATRKYDWKERHRLHVDIARVDDEQHLSYDY